MLRRNQLVIIVLMAILTGSPVWLGAETGRSSATILIQDNSARLTALGGSGLAWQGSADLLLMNPAGLSGLSYREVKLMHIAGIEGLATEVALGALPLATGGGIGLQAMIRSAPTIDNEGATDPPVESRDVVVGAALALPFTEKLTLGAQLKLINLKLGPAESANLALDVGAQYQLNSIWRLGLAALNLGPEVEWLSAADPMPSTFAAGAHVLLWEQNTYLWSAGLDGRYLVPEQMLSFHFGTELEIDKQIVLRAGGKVSTETMASNFAAGIGFRFKLYRLQMAIDYTFSPEFWDDVDLELKNMISLSALF